VSTHTYTPTVSHSAYQLGRAIADMAGRYGSSTRKGAYAFARLLDGGGADARADMERLERAAERQFKALQRLTAALRDLPLKEGR
jgi:hypothetical protein